jgi:dUTPase
MSNSAGIDLYQAFDLDLLPREECVVDFRVAFELPPDVFLQVVPNAATVLSHRLTVHGGVVGESSSA